LDEGDAHVLYDVGVGATHLANFAAAAFVGATASAVLSNRRRGHLLGVLGIVLTVVQLVNAPFQIAATSHWSDVVGGFVFICFLVWVFAASVWLVLATRRTVPATASS
jgi:ABC-type transport system involved in cytochrome c biogenesis permease component